MLDIKTLAAKILSALATQTATCTKASGWENYNNGEDPTVKRKAGVCEFAWETKPSTALSPLGGTWSTICTLPAGYRPERTVLTLHQGSGTLFYASRILPSGAVQLGRLRDVGNSNTQYSNAATNFWFPLHMTFFVGGGTA